MSFELKDKVAVVTGAAGGIGSLVVINLAKENAKHIAILDVAESAAIALQDDVNKQYRDKVKFYKCDVTKEDQIISVLKAVNESQGSIDVLINNAAILNDSFKTYKLQIDLNVFGLVACTLHGLELMRKDKGGKGGVILNISSTAALCQMPLSPIYSATKSAVLQFSNCIGLPDYYLRTGVRVVTVCFGATETPLISVTNLGSFDEEIQKNLNEVAQSTPSQKPEAAAAGVIEVLKKGESASTWLVTDSKPAKDITGDVQKAYDILYSSTV